MDSSMNQPYQQQQNSFGLTRYASAPSSFFDNIIGSSGGRGIDSAACEDSHYPPQSTNPASDSMFTGFLPSDGSGNSESLHKYEEGLVKQKERGIALQQNGYMNGTQMLYHNLQANGSQNGNPENMGNTMRSQFSGLNTTAMDNMVHEKMTAGNCSNLERQRSSPADFFSNLSAENGFAVGGMSSHVSFSNRSSTSSKFMPQSTGTENQNMGTSSLQYGNPINGYGTKRHHPSNFSSDFWDDSALHIAERPKDSNRNVGSAMESFEIQNGSCNDHSLSLTRHLSMPITFGETDVSEKFLNFQDAVPCKIRAKRGCATHPRSIAERVRRTRISERIRKLQELFPNIGEHTNTSDMLDSAVECIKNLQKEVKALTDAKAKCLCHSKQEE